MATALGIVTNDMAPVVMVIGTNGTALDMGTVTNGTTAVLDTVINEMDLVMAGVIETNGAAPSQAIVTNGTAPTSQTVVVAPHMAIVTSDMVPMSLAVLPALLLGIVINVKATPTSSQPSIPSPATPTSARLESYPLTLFHPSTALVSSFRSALALSGTYTSASYRCVFRQHCYCQCHQCHHHTASPIDACATVNATTTPHHRLMRHAEFL